MASVSSTPNNDGALTRYYSKVVADAEKEKQSELKRTRERSDRELKHVEDTYKSTIDKNSEETENALKNLRMDSQEAISAERDHSRESLDRAKEQLYNQKGQYDGDKNLDRKIFENFIDETGRRKELEKHNFDMVETKLRDKLGETGHDNDEKLKDFKDAQSKAFDASHEHNNKLMDEVQNAAFKQQQDVSQRNMERDDQMQREFRQVNQAYQAQVDKLDKALRAKDQYYGGLTNETVAEKDLHYDKLLRNQNSENHRDFQNLEKSFETHTKNAEQVAKKNEERRETQLANQVTESDKDRELALNKQAKNYQNTVSQQRKSDEGTIQELQKALLNTKTSTDISLISPAAEEALRKNLAENFQKSITIEREKHQQLEGDLYEKRVGDLVDARETYQDQIAKTNREFVRSQASDRAGYYGNILDTERDANYKLMDKDSQNARQVETLHHHYTRLLDKQKKDYDNAFDATRISSQNRINEIRQDSELAIRLEHKDFAARSNMLIKDFEKKLTDQKDAYEIKLDDMKTQAAADIRASEQKGKVDLELQAKNYDLKIAQIQSQTKERERTISQNFQDELDRTRRSYELVIQKKS